MKIIALAVVLFCSVAANAKDFPRYAPKPGVARWQYAEDHKSGLYFDPNDILAQYAVNEVKGDAELLGNRLTVQGMVYHIGKNSSDAPSIFFLSESELERSVVCEFNTAAPLVNVRPGQTICIYGKVKKGSDYSVTLTDCEITFLGSK